MPRRPGAPVSRARVSVSLGLFYAAYFGTVGVSLPFFPVWLQSRGLDPSEIGMILSATFWVKVVSNPAWATVADRSGRRRPLFAALPLAALLGYLGFSQADALLTFAACGLLVGGTFSALVPLGESLAIRATETHGVDYGRVRLWGSLGFIVTSTLGGVLLTDRDPALILPSVAALVALSWLAGLSLPDLRRERPAAPRGAAWRLVTRPEFLLFLLCASAVGASHITYYGFSAIHWKASGHSATIVGLLWAEGVVAEVVLFWLGTRLTARFSPAALVAAGALAAALRWTAFAHTTSLPLLAAAQALHGLSFGAVHLGAVAYLRKRVPEELRATATSVYAAAVAGIAFGTASPIAGALYEAHRGLSFHFSTALALAGLLLTPLLARAMRRRATP